MLSNIDDIDGDIDTIVLDDGDHVTMGADDDIELVNIVEQENQRSSYASSARVSKHVPRQKSGFLKDLKNISQINVALNDDILDQINDDKNVATPL